MNRAANPFDALNEGDRQLFIEALVTLRQKKVEAFKIVGAAPMPAGFRPFTRDDFGIPQINGLLVQLAGEEVPEDDDPTSTSRAPLQVVVGASQ